MEVNKIYNALDLFCGAGGASRGLVDAGFEVIGIDIKPQQHYPYKFIQTDVRAINVDFIRGFDFIWASPPCQKFSVMTKRWGKENKHPDLIEPTRKMLIESGVPYCIENVIGAPLISPFMLCGSMFNLQTKAGSQLRRHRLFECPWLSEFHLHPLCNHHKGSVIGVYGGGQHPQRRRIPATIGVYGHAGSSSKRDCLDFSCFTTQDRKDAMGIQWMTGNELSQAVPPAYSKYIAELWLKNIKECLWK